MKRLLPFFLLLFLLSGCADSNVTRQQFFAMDTTMTITAHGRAAAQAVPAAQAEINRLEALLSPLKPKSDIARLNAAAGSGIPVPIAPETEALLALSARGAPYFNPVIAPIMSAWGFGSTPLGTDAVYRVPAQEELDALLPLTRRESLVLDDVAHTAQLLQGGMAADLGGIAKGFAGDAAAKILKDAGVKSALIDLGGNLTALGNKPDGKPWRIAVKHPLDVTRTFCTLPLSGQTAATSGGYERNFTENGVTYHHILDPKTGRPAASGLLSVTAIAAQSAQADLLSTTCFIAGADASLTLWRKMVDAPFDLILVSDEGHVFITEGLKTSLTFDTEGSGLTYEIVHR